MYETFATGKATSTARQRQEPHWPRWASGPDFTYVLNGSHGDSDAGEVLDYIHRRNGQGGHLLCPQHRKRKAWKLTASFRVHGRTPELWMAGQWSHNPALVYKETEDGRTEIPLTIPPAGFDLFCL